jgi:hypothetical protein
VDAPSAATTTGRSTIPAERFIPIWMARAHGLFGGGTLGWVLLERAGVS